MYIVFAHINAHKYIVKQVIPIYVFNKHLLN